MLVVLGACSTPEDPSVLARVHDQVMKVADLRALESDGRHQNLSEEELFTRRRMDLQALIDRELLLVQARVLNLDQDKEVVRLFKANKEVNLARSMMRSEVVDRITVAPTEVAQVYQAGWDERIRSKEIFVETSADAKRVVTALAQGTSFDKVAKDYSVDPVMRVPTGESRVGSYLPFDAPRSLVELLFDLQPGEWTEPIYQTGGYVIAKVVERDSLSLVELQGPIGEELAKEKAQVLRATYLRRLREEIALRDDTTGLELVVKVLRDETSLSELTQVERQNPVYKTSDFILDVATVVTHLRAGADKWTRATLPSVIDAIRDRILTVRVLAWDARRKGRHQLPEFLEWSQRERDKLMITQLRERVLVDSVKVTEGAIKDHYEDVRYRFRIPAAVHIREILVIEPRAADELRTRIIEGETFAALAPQHTIRGEGKQVSFWVYDVQTPLYSEEWMKSVFNAPVGRLVGPLLTKGGYSIFEVIERSAESYHSLDLPRVHRAVERDVREAEERNVFNRYVEQLRSQATSVIEIYEDNLRALGPSLAEPESSS